jgi:hypothetical protein
MIPLVGLIVATYAVARLIQVPVEAAQAWKGRMVVLWLVSIPSILVIGALAIALLFSSSPTSGLP